jgi:hypothetical protein
MVNLTRDFKENRPFTGIESAQSAMKYIVLLACAVLASCVQPPAAQAPSNAQQALEMAVRDYEKANLKTLEAMLPASFIGRDSLLDAARRAMNDQRNIRVEITEVQTQTTGASQALTFKWEKRFIRASSGASVTERGSTQTVLSKATGAWTIQSLPADNLFTR